MLRTTAAFLSGRDEDPEQRRLYEEALTRATQQVAGIASERSERVKPEPLSTELMSG